MTRFLESSPIQTRPHFCVRLGTVIMAKSQVPSSIVATTLVALAVCAGLIHASDAKPPCYTPLNPALETICYTTISTSGNFSLRTYGGGLNVR